MTEPKDILAAQYALGTLSAAERAEMTDKARIDPALAAAIDKWEQLLAPLALTGDEALVSPDLWGRIEASLDFAKELGSFTRDIRLGDGVWESMVPGIERKPLWDENTFLIRAAPGAVLPPHEHPTYEHCLVLSGTMMVGDVPFYSGDYHAAKAGTAHGELWTPDGTLVLIRYDA